MLNFYWFNILILQKVKYLLYILIISQGIGTNLDIFLTSKHDKYHVLMLKKYLNLELPRWF